MDQERHTYITRLKHSLAVGKTLEAVSLGGDPGDPHPDYPTVVWRIRPAETSQQPVFALVGRDPRGMEHILFEQVAPSLEVLFSNLPLDPLFFTEVDSE
jgi:hypothetical protein